MLVFSISASRFFAVFAASVAVLASSSSSGGGIYVLVGGASAPARLGRPIERTPFFAGEGTESEEGGTVQAAIRSGRRAAKQALR